MHIIKWLLKWIRGSAVPRPTGRFTWERIIERAELPHAAKLVAFIMATFANEDGSRVRPGQGRIAAACDWTEKYVAQQIRILREAGLLLQVRPAAGPFRPPLYQLSLPDDGPVPMRLDESGYRYEPKKPGKGGAPKGGWPKKDGTPVPETANSSSDAEPAQPNPSSVSAEPQFAEDPTETTAAEPQFPKTGTPVPEDRNSSSPNQPRPTKTNPVSSTNLTPTSAGARSDEAANQHDVHSPDPKVAYRSAERVLVAVSRGAADAAITEARAQLAPEGITGVRQITISAAQILTAYADEAARRKAGPS